MKSLLFAAALVSCLSSCSCSTEPRYRDDYDARYDTTPTTVVTPATGTTVIQQDNSSALLHGVILGHLMSGSNSGGSSSRNKTVNKTTIINQTVRAPRGTTRSSATVRSTYTPSPVRTRSSMSSRSMYRRR